MKHIKTEYTFEMKHTVGVSPHIPKYPHGPANLSIWCAGGRHMDCFVCHCHTVNGFIASTYTLTLTHLSYGETFLGISVRYGVRSCCSSDMRI